MACDFLDVFHSDVSKKILMFLDDPADIVRACSVSRAWRDFVIANGICKHLCVKLFPQLSCFPCPVDISNTQERGADIGCSRSFEWEHLNRQHRMYTKFAWGLSSSKVGDCLSDAISASSTDHYPEEGVHNTLESRDRIGRRAFYWSSSGKAHPDVSERLTYKLISDLCVVTEINVRPLQASFIENSPIFSAKAVRFRMGHRILPDDDDGDLIIEHEGQLSGEKFVWTYTSKEYSMVQENRLQNFKLPEPVLCIGGILQIELIGSVQRDQVDGLFYTCVAYVQVVGRPLPPIFGVKFFEPVGRFMLVYNPEATFNVPISIHMQLGEVMVVQHAGGWLQIRNLLRGTLGVEVYDSDDSDDSDEDMDEDLA